MRTIRATVLAIAAALCLAAAPAFADKYADTVSLFKNAGQSASFFGKSYAYAVFPTVGKAGLGIGARTVKAGSTSKASTSATRR